MKNMMREATQNMSLIEKAENGEAIIVGRIRAMLDREENLKCNAGYFQVISASIENLLAIIKGREKEKKSITINREKVLAEAQKIIINKHEEINSKKNVPEEFLAELCELTEDIDRLAQETLDLYYAKQSKN